MELTDRLFSENNPEETYYSVLMSEPEYSIYSQFIEFLYSEDDDDDDDDEEADPNTIKLAKALGVGSAAAFLGGATTVGASHLYEKIPNTPAWRNAKKGALAAGVIGTSAALADVYKKHKHRHKKRH